LRQQVGHGLGLVLGHGIAAEGCRAQARIVLQGEFKDAIEVYCEHR
jgi:hypothetical protein